MKEKTKLSPFLGLLSGGPIVFVNRTNARFEMKRLSKIGMKMPVLADGGVHQLQSRL